MQTFPARIVKALGVSGKMLFRESARFFNVFRGKDLSCKVCLRDVLQSGHLRMIKKTAARANVGVDEARVRRVLPPMRELVAIGVEDRIEAKGLDESSDCWPG